jgi:glycosyltransferase involved in cell wall biosynthesis
MPALSLIMPCHDRAHDLARTLQGYERQSGDAPFEIVAVDDGSTDRTHELLRSYRPQRFTLRVERLERSGGPAGARNLALELVQAPLTLFVGDDIGPDPGLLAAHLAAHAHTPEPQVAVLGRIAWPDDMPVNTLMTHIDGVGAQQFSYHYFRDGTEYDYRHLYTSNVSLKTAFLRQTDARFDTEFPYAAMEDAELGYRLARHGLRIRFDASPVGYHYHYHTIWSFAVRQYRAGLMAAVLVQKHPELLHDLRVAKTRLLRWLAWLHRVDRAWHPRDRGEWLEEQALSLASSYEWTPHAQLDGLYLGVLDYFWQKGLIDAVFADPQRGARVRNAYAAAVLAPLLRGFIERAAAQGVPLPWPNHAQRIAELAALQPRTLRTHLVGRHIPAWGRRLYAVIQPWWRA